MSDKSAQLRQIAEWIEESGRKITGEIDDQTDDGRQVDGFRVDHGNKPILVYSIEGTNYFKVQIEFSVIKSVAIKVAVQELDIDPSSGGDVQVNLTKEHEERAKSLIATKNKEQKEWSEKLRVKLIQQLSHPSAGFRLLTELNGPHGFELQTKLFPEDATISDFDKACQTVVSLAVVPREILARAYNAETTVDTQDEQTSPLGPASRGFQ